MIETTHFKLHCAKGRYFITAKAKNVCPKGRRVTAADAAYLMALSAQPNKHTAMSTFDCACVMDMGVGVFAK